MAEFCNITIHVTIHAASDDLFIENAEVSYEDGRVVIRLPEPDTSKLENLAVYQEAKAKMKGLIDAN